VDADVQTRERPKASVVAVLWSHVHRPEASRVLRPVGQEELQGVRALLVEAQGALTPRDRERHVVRAPGRHPVALEGAYGAAGELGHEERYVVVLDRPHGRILGGPATVAHGAAGLRTLGDDDAAQATDTLDLPDERPRELYDVRPEVSQGPRSCELTVVASRVGDVRIRRVQSQRAVEVVDLADLAGLQSSLAKATAGLRRKLNPASVVTPASSAARYIDRFD
jgi:hypothetical protein